MSSLAIISIVFGVFIVAVRTPLIFVPEATVAIYRKLISTNIKIRIMGICLVPLGLAMITIAMDSQQAAAMIIVVFGWIVAFIAVVLCLFFASIYKKIVEEFLVAIDDSSVFLLIGIIGTALGAFFIYLGLFVY
jgi:hypothetical protein